MLHAWQVGDRWNPATIPIAVWQCQRCELVILHPVPRAEQLPAAGDWWGRQKNFRRRRWFKTVWEPLRSIVTGGPDAQLIRGTRKACRGGKFLDIGCGAGLILQQAEPYFDELVGIEPSPIAAEATRALGFEVLEGMFEDVDVEWGTFDVVMMNAVIEHVLSPTDAMLRMNRCLKVGGVMCLKTPKFGGPAYRMHKSGWNGFRHGYHTYLFTGKTLGAIMEKTGFEVLQSPSRDRWLDDILVLWGRKVRDVAECPTSSLRQAG